MANPNLVFFFGGHSFAKFRFSSVMNQPKSLTHRNGLMKAVIIYNDVACAKTAITILRRASSSSSVHWEFKPWHADMLGLREAADEALKEAVDAELIVLADLSGHGFQPLVNWLQSWGARRSSRESALILTRGTPNSEFSQQVFSFAAENGVDLIVEASPTVGPQRLIYDLAEPTSESAVSLTSDELLILQAGSPQNSYRCWGINE
jgi:hypothetical protein